MYRRGHPIVEFLKLLSIFGWKIVLLKSCPILKIPGNVYDEMLVFDLFHFEHFN